MLCWLLSLSPFVERPVSTHCSITVLYPVSGSTGKNLYYYREKPSLSSMFLMYRLKQYKKIGGKKTWINIISNSQPFRWPLGASKISGRHWTDSYANSSAFHHQHHTALCSQDREKADFLKISLLA